MAASLQGAFPVLPTIFDEYGAVDEAGFRSVVSFVLSSGADGVVFPGLASEYDCLSIDERFRLIDLVGELCAGRAAFIVGASADDPADTLKLVEAGARAGASAAMVMTPKCFDGDVEATARFYEDLGRSTALPIMLQNAPRPMGVRLAPEDVIAIARRAPAVRYVKEETIPCGQRISALLADVPESVRGVFGGAGGRYILDELARGAVGTMPAAELSDLHALLIEASRTGDGAHARNLYERMLPILTMQAVFRWALTKEVLRRRGVIDCAFVRAPGPRLDAGDDRELTTMLARLEDLIGPTVPASKAEISAEVVG